MLPARGDGGLHRPGATAGQTAKARIAAGSGRRRQHRPGATAAHTHRHSPYHAATSAGARGTPSSTLPQARTVSVAAGPSTPPISDALIPPPPPPSPLPAPADAGGAADTRRRRWQQWEPLPLQRRARSRRRQQREAAVAASGGGEIKTQWLTLFLSRTCKRGSNQAGAATIRISPGPDRIISRINKQDKRDKIAG